ncbi:DUF819 domain-containing protein [Lihuaxuella thermophila]|uniref:Uncharacterized membrane protein n=1 Tax=Lihuaxuella thermophila TaxID=1173111 RepID=A0A1H8IE61_9BACL|nr:DUF819 family protein [Lihuaxuella thermophila]SEN66591.1 Uncharacterized membrane protein [Lihuaxuella thermophila]
MTTEALITNPTGVAAVIAGLIAISFWLDRRFRFFSYLGTAILVITGGAVLVNAGIIPPSIVENPDDLHPIYQFANDYCVPLSIVLLLISTDFKSLRYLGKPALLSFCLASAGTLIGSIIGVWLTADGIGTEAWKIAGQFAASYIGGGVNYAAVGAAFQTSQSMFATGAAADNIMTNLWMVATAILPSLLVKYYPSIQQSDRLVKKADEDFWAKKGISIYDMVTLAAVAFAVVAVSDLLAPVINDVTGFQIPAVVWYTTFAILLALFTPVHKLNGGAEWGNLLLHFFFATMGAGTILSTLVDKGPVVFMFLVILVGVHALIVFGFGKWFQIDVEILAVASQATVGGPSTALALASSKRWFSLITPGVLMGVLGYAIGNYVGILVGHLTKLLLS